MTTQVPGRCLTITVFETAIVNERQKQVTAAEGRATASLRIPLKIVPCSSLVTIMYNRMPNSSTPDVF